MTDPLGASRRYGYDAAGRSTSETDAAGHVTTFTYDDNGKQLDRDAHPTRPGGGTQTLTTQSEYDAAGRLHQDHRRARRPEPLTTYSPLGDGKKPATHHRCGRSPRTFTHDARSAPDARTFPDGSTETATYDAENHQLTRTDRDGHTTTYAYDALGRRTASRIPTARRSRRPTTRAAAC